MQEPEVVHIDFSLLICASCWCAVPILIHVLALVLVTCGLQPPSAVPCFGGWQLETLFQAMQRCRPWLLQSCHFIGEGGFHLVCANEDCFIGHLQSSVFVDKELLLSPSQRHICKQVA